MMRVDVTVLCGLERTNWLCPPLALWLLNPNMPPGMQLDFDFEVDSQPVWRARNIITNRAHARKYDWVAMLDNDGCPSASFLKSISEAESLGIEIFGEPMPVLSGRSSRWNFERIAGGAESRIGPFMEVSAIGTGALAIRLSAVDALTKPYFYPRPEPGRRPRCCAR